MRKIFESFIVVITILGWVGLVVGILSGITMVIIASIILLAVVFFVPLRKG